MKHLVTLLVAGLLWPMGWDVLYKENVVLGTSATAEEAISQYMEVRPALIKICIDNGGDVLTFPDMTQSPRLAENGDWHIGTEFCVKPPAHQLARI